MNNLSNDPHPDDLLGGYALHAIDQVEEPQVDAHMEGCLQCRQAVSQLHEVASRLGQSVAPLTPAPYLQSRIMAALQQTRPPIIPTLETAPPFGFGRRLARLLVPMAGVLVILFVLSLVYNVRLAGRIDQLEMENVSVSARLFNFSLENARLLEALQQQDVSSYLLANPASQPMLLEPPQGNGKSQGVLLVADDGRHAILMVAGMQETAPGTGYQVWVLRPGEGLRMGQLEVDSTGWGAKDLFLPEPLFQFDRVELRPTAGGGSSSSGGKVLEGKVASMQRPK